MFELSRFSGGRARNGCAGTGHLLGCSTNGCDDVGRPARIGSAWRGGDEDGRTGSSHCLRRLRSSTGDILDLFRALRLRRAALERLAGAYRPSLRVRAVRDRIADSRGGGAAVPRGRIATPGGSVEHVRRSLAPVTGPLTQAPHRPRCESAHHIGPARPLLGGGDMCAHCESCMPHLEGGRQRLRLLDLDLRLSDPFSRHALGRHSPGSRGGLDRLSG